MSVRTIRGGSFPVGTPGPALAPGRSGQARRSATTALPPGQVQGVSLSQDTEVAPGPAPDRVHGGKPRQRLIVLALVTAVIVLDQAVKWWAWRHVAGVRINSGGDVLVGPAIGAWYAAPVTGALLDLLDVGLLSAALCILVRRRRPAAVLVSGALMLGGWCSNLLDRLGVHYWTAPGSVRGVVDFICLGGARYNVADLFITSATPLFLVTLGFLGRGAADQPPATVMAAAARHRPRASMLALVGAALVAVAVALGAANYGGVKAVPAHVSAKGDGPARSVAAA
jgi:lipoprotein signal peptidase